MKPLAMGILWDCDTNMLKVNTNANTAYFHWPSDYMR